jgi:hypothetical protein
MNKNGRLTHALESEPALRGGRRSFLPIGAVAVFCMIGAALAQAAPAEPAASSKPNILIIWGDDIGGFNISATIRA